MSRAAKSHQKKLARKAALKRRTSAPRAVKPRTHVAPADYLSALTDKGLTHHLAGRLGEAEAIYRQVLDAKPGHVDANHLLGELAHQAGDHERAVELISKAIAKAPRQPVFRNNLGNVLHALGRLAEASASYHKAIAIEPDYAAAHNNLANLLMTQGQMEAAAAGYDRALAINPGYAEAHYNLATALEGLGRMGDAVSRYEKAIELNPQYADAHGNLANILRNLGRLDDAAASYQMALALAPNSADIHSNFGNALEDLGRRDEAMASYRTAIRINPEFAEAHNNLGNLFGFLGQPDDAVASYRRALAIKPDYAEAHCNLAAAHQFQGRSLDALAHFRQAIALKPQIDAFWTAFVACLETGSFTTADESLFNDLLLVCERTKLRSNAIGFPVISALRHHADFSRILDLTGPGKSHADIDVTDVAARLAAIPLFLRVIEQTPINDLGVERMLTKLRRALLEAALSGDCADVWLAFSTALALHCFTNEYVFSETTEELAAVEQLERRIGVMLEEETAVPPALVAVLASYRPLHRSPLASRLSKGEWPDVIQQLLTRQIVEPDEEYSLRSGIPHLTPIDHEVSLVVRAQYEENPYPRWIKFDIESNPQNLSTVLRNPPLDFDLGDDEPAGSPDILIAGCGTGQNALMAATSYENARVLAIDLSLSSLTYAVRKTNELGLTNIEYAQADITELATLGRQFDLIESLGVLHHLGDPMHGWQVLVDLLRPGGLMKIGLYSEAAREPVVKARELIAERGYTTSAEDIRRCRKDFLEMAKEEGSAIAKLVESKDFFTLSECRDLIFHVQEHRFTLPRIEVALKTLKLKFLGFEIGNQAILREFKKVYPHVRAAASLPQWHEFEREHPDTFWGMYQFWCRKK